MEILDEIKELIPDEEIDYFEEYNIIITPKGDDEDE